MITAMILLVVGAMVAQAIHVKNGNGQVKSHTQLSPQY